MLTQRAARRTPPTAGRVRQSAWAGRRRRHKARATDQQAASVEVHDQFLPRSIQSKILHLMERPKWSFTGGHPPNQFWHMAARKSFSATSVFRLFAIGSAGLSSIEKFMPMAGATSEWAPALDDGDITFLVSKPGVGSLLEWLIAFLERGPRRPNRPLQA